MIIEIPTENGCRLEYNTERTKLRLTEYGRNVQQMVEHIMTIEDKEKRNNQIRAVIKAMEILNPGVHSQDNFEQKLWDHMHIISNYEMDVDSPYPVPEVSQIESVPQVVPIQKRPIKATHYGMNIESIIDLIAEQPDGENKTAMIRSLAIYMRQQYLIWNKDSVADETIFKDIEKLSEGRIVVPEGLSLSRISDHATFSRPMMSINVGQGQNNNNRPWQRNNRRHGMKRK